MFFVAASEHTLIEVNWVGSEKQKKGFLQKYRFREKRIRSLHVSKITIGLKSS